MNVTPEQALAIVDEVTFPSARGGRKPSQPISVSVVRGLTPDDLPGLEAPPPIAQGQRLAGLKHTHHQLAQLIATGVALQQASLITGYSGAYISILQADPAFQELLAHYGQEREQVFIDVAERMKGLGLDTLDELQARLNDPEAKWANRELMELAELMLVKGRTGVGAGPGSQPGQARPTVQINFVKAAPTGPRVIGDETIVIEEPGL